MERGYQKCKETIKGKAMKYYGTATIEIDIDDVFYNLRTDEQQAFISYHLDDVDDDDLIKELERRGFKVLED